MLEYIWASMDVPFLLTNLPYVKCNIVLPLDVVQLDNFNSDYGSYGQSSYIVQAEVDCT